LLVVAAAALLPLVQDWLVAEVLAVILPQALRYQVEVLIQLLLEREVLVVQLVQIEV
jgi:hypothetical protein